MRTAICMLIFSFCLLSFSGDIQTKPSINKSTKKRKTGVQYGMASFYHNKFNGRKTANGEVFSQKKLTGAHNTLPLGTWVRVTNLKNNKTVVVKVIDRLHYKSKRLIDLSRTAARKIGFSRSGLVRVKVEVVGSPTPIVKTK
ncbi:MAG: septal ring lytic transglycosylase RlpA family protein [Chitinophagaceae bacterium]